MKTKLFEFDPVVYPFPVIVCKYVPGVTSAEIAQRYNKVVDKKTMMSLDADELLAFPTLTAKTLCVVDKETEYMKYLIILYRPKKCRWGVVSHEALHVVTMLCDWIGISPPTLNEDEPHAYLIQWIANCIGSVLEGHPERMKGKLLKFEDYAAKKTESNTGGQD